MAEVPDIKKEHTFIIPLDPKGKLTVKIDLHRQMTQKEIEASGLLNIKKTQYIRL